VGRVKDLIILAAPCLMLAMLYCLWRAASLFGSWKAATATVRDSDYSEREREDDFWHFGFTVGTLRGFNWRDGDHARLIQDRIEFTDADGEQHRATVERRVRRGWRPSGAYTVWYDPKDPAQVTAFGPGYWLMIALAMGAALVGIFAACIDLARP
jgi:Protein of unknown function (DUF3592)